MTSRAGLITTLLCAFTLPVHAQDSPTPDEAPAAQPTIQVGVDYRVYDREGNPSSLLAIIGAALGDDVLLVGEEHDDMIGHAFETELFLAALDEIGGAAASGRAVVLSMEMFERDVQYVLDEYLAGMISEEHFLKSSRPWPDYESRYRPLIEIARERGSAVIAANAPRRYVSRVTSEGPESLIELSAHARSYLPPLPYPGPSDVYRDQWDAVMAEAMEGRDYQTNPNAVYSQALWDASMGHAITEALVRHMGSLVIHFVGSFHVGRGTGVPERIADYRPGTSVTTVVMTKVDDIDAWSVDEHAGLGDFVVLTKKSEDVATEGN